MHERGEPHRVARVVGEHEEGAGIGRESAVQREAVHHGRHRELAHSVVDVVTAALMTRHGLGILAEGVDRAGEVRRTAQQFAHPRPERVEHHLRRGTGRLRGIDGRGGGQGGVAQLRPISGKRTRHAAGELHGEIGELAAVAVEAALPGALGALAAGALVPVGADVLRHHERRVRPTQRCARGRDLFDAERLAMRRLAALLVRGAETDHRARADERRLAAVGLSPPQRLEHRVAVMTVQIFDDLPTAGGEALRGVISHPAADRTIDGDAVVVVDADELAESKRTGERDRFVRDAFHQAAVADEDISVMIDDVVSRTVELRRQ